MSPNLVSCPVEIRPRTERLGPRGKEGSAGSGKKAEGTEVSGRGAPVWHQRSSNTTAPRVSSGAISRKALPRPHPGLPPAHWMVHLSRSRAWPSRRTLALMYLRSLLTLGRRAKGETMP